MSDWRNSLDDELAVVFEQAKAIVSAYPEPMDSRGLLYLDKFNPLLPDSTKNYICYCLPFWSRDITGADVQTCRRLSLANVFIMLYFFIQDDLMDAPPSDWKEQLALGNLFYTSFLDLYRADFDGDSPFWDYFRTYITEWASAVASEGRASGSESDPIRLARKAGPVKLASTGALLLTGRAPLIPEVSHLVDQTLITLQMADDWVDWEEDLEQGSDNSLLDFIRSELSIPADELSAAQVSDSLALKGSLERFAAQAVNRHKDLLALRIKSPDLLAFHESLAQGLLSAAENLKQRKSSLARGGFLDWLSKSIGN